MNRLKILSHKIKSLFKCTKFRPAHLPIIQSLWIGNDLTTMEQICISSFINNGHEFVLYTYNDIKNIPKYTIIKDANNIINESRIFKYKKHDSYSGFSNIFRYKLLYEKGGYWVDTDIFCLKPFTINENYVFSSQFNKDKTINANPCLMKTPKKSEIMKICYEKSISKDTDLIEWGEIGPRLLTKSLKEIGMWDRVSAPKVFCPVNWWNWNYFTTESDMNMFKNSLSVHFWNEMWRRNKKDKSIRYPKHCVYEQLKRMYG